MKKYKNFMPIYYNEAEKDKIGNSLNKFIKIIMVLNLILMPITFNNVNNIYFREESIPTIASKGLLIKMQGMENIMEFTEKYNLEINIENDNFTIKDLKEVDNNIRIEDLRGVFGVNIKSIVYEDEFNVIQGSFYE